MTLTTDISENDFNFNLHSHSSSIPGCVLYCSTVKTSHFAKPQMFESKVNKITLECWLERKEHKSSLGVFGTIGPGERSDTAHTGSEADVLHVPAVCLAYWVNMTYPQSTKYPTHAHLIKYTKLD